MTSPQTYVYFAAPVGGSPIKIGCTCMPMTRLSTLCNWSPVKLEILAYAPGSFADESWIQHQAAASWSHCEWFEASAFISALIAEIKQSGKLPDYAFAPGPVRSFRAALKKPSNVRTPEWRKRQSDAVKRGWKRRKKMLLDQLASQ